MRLTPLDIKKQEFKKSLRGYDSIEVEAFLEMISEEYESLIRERNHLSDEVLKLKTQLKDYQQVERSFKESLMKAQQTVEQQRDNAKHEAELILREAELKAEKLLEGTKIQLTEMKDELMLVKSQKDSFAKRLKHLLESQIEMISVLEIDDIGLNRLVEKIETPQMTSTSKKNVLTNELEFTAVEEDDDENELIASDRKKTLDYQYAQTDLPIAPEIQEQENSELHPTQNSKRIRINKRRVKLSDQFII